MAHEEDAGWGPWLCGKLAALEWRQADLVERSGGELKASIVSRWCADGATPSADAAVLVADVLGADPAGALRASRHLRLAALVDQAPTAPVDATIARIRGARVPARQRARWECAYREQQRAVQRLFVHGVQEWERTAQDHETQCAGHHDTDGHAQ